jgi:D-beta-D-heptose 7-phosphate kinase/D-beta-D-heptose 1-phosphate adenosyltransferase
VVGLNSDESVRRLKGAARPINSQEERAAVLGELNYIDYIYVFYEDTPADLIERLRPNVIVKGGDYTKDNVVGREFAERVDIFHTIPNKSTTRIIERAAATD